MSQVRMQAPLPVGVPSSTRICLTTVVRSNFFNRYVAFAFEVERVPTETLASWSESCKCHEPLYLLEALTLMRSQCPNTCGGNC
jgi:hypothetical protein